MPLRHADRDFTVEAPGAPQGEVDEFRHVGRADDDDFPAAHEAVHQRQELRHDALFHVAHDGGPFRGERVHFVEEDDGGSVLPGFLENRPQLGLALPVELVDELGAVHVEEVGPDLVGDGAGDEGLPGSRGTREKDSLGGIDPQLGEQLGELQGKLDHLPDVAELLFQPADVLVGGPRRLLGGEIGTAEGDFRMGRDPDGAPGACALHHVEHRLGAEHGDLDAVADDHVEARQELPYMRDLLVLRKHAADIDRGQDDAVGLLVGDLLDGAFLVDRDLRVVARDAVDEHEPLAAVLLGGVRRAGDRGAASGDEESVAGNRVQPVQIIRIQTGQALAFILDKRSSNFQGKIILGFRHCRSPRRGMYGAGQLVYRIQTDGQTKI